MNAKITLKNFPLKEYEELPKEYSELDLSEENKENFKKKLMENYTFSFSLDFPCYHLILGKDFSINKNDFEKSFLKEKLIKKDDSCFIPVIKIIGASLIRKIDKNDLDFGFEFSNDNNIKFVLFYSINKRREMLQKLSSDKNPNVVISEKQLEKVEEEVENENCGVNND